jgi:ribosome-associated protein
VAATEQARELALVAAHAAAGKKAQEVVLLDVSDQLVITDCFVIASASNERQVQAIVEAVEEKMRNAGTKPVRREGAREGRWVLLDFVDVVVHVQHAQERSFYGLERLWKDCPAIPFDPGPVPPDDDTDGAG